MAKQLPTAIFHTFNLRLLCLMVSALSLINTDYLPLYTIPCSASMVTKVPDFNILVAFLAATMTGISKAIPTIAAWE